MDWLVLALIVAVVFATISLLAALRRIAAGVERIADAAEGKARTDSTVR